MTEEEENNVVASVLFVPANTPRYKLQKLIRASNPLCFSQFFEKSYIPSPDPHVFFTDIREIMADNSRVNHMHMSLCEDSVPSLRFCVFDDAEEARKLYESVRKKYNM
jgi:hypothetical protein